MNVRIPRGLLIGVGIAQLATFSIIFAPRFLPDRFAFSTPFVIAFVSVLLLSTILLLVELVILLLSLRRNILISVVYFVVAIAETAYVCYILFNRF